MRVNRRVLGLMHGLSKKRCAKGYRLLDGIGSPDGVDFRHVVLIKGECARVAVVCDSVANVTIVNGIGS